MVANLDHNVGRLLDALDARGLTDDTLVIFTSDHGPCPSANVDGRIRYNAGLRGTKCTMYEGGLRVPCFVRWPRAISAGTTVTAPTNPIDILPTLAAATGLTPSATRPPDGANLLPALAQHTPLPERTLCLQWHRGNRPELHRCATAVTARWKWIRPESDAADELYDVTVDPGETTNLAATHPDIVQQLRGDYEAWFADVSLSLGATPAENFAPVPIPIGDPREPAPWLTWQDWRRPDGAPESWAAHLPGDWHLVILRAGRHRLTLEFAANKHPRTAQVRSGDLDVKIPVPAGADRLESEPLELSAGLCTLCVRLSTGDEDLPLGVSYAQLTPLEM